MIKKICLSLISIVLTLLLFEIALQLYFKVRHGLWFWQREQAFNISFVSSVDDRREYSLTPLHKNDIFSKKS